MSRTEAEVDRLFRQQSARAVATIAKTFGDLELAEDAVQEAYLRLVTSSAYGTLPENPTAWILRTARNCAIDRIRRSTAQAGLLERLARLEPTLPDEEHESESNMPDDRLELIFACAHPALSMQSRVALTLRSVCGLTTRQIASAFFVPEATMMRRLARAKQKVREAHISFELPPPSRLAERLESVLAVIYLIFNEGYKASAGDALTDLELCEEAVWLAGLVQELMPGEPEARGLLCLLLFHHSRRATRVGVDGALQTLEVQDRSRWDRPAIARGIALLTERGPLEPTPYVVEAEIAAHHATAESFQKTDWTRIAALYEVLALMKPSPTVGLNRAIAVGMAFGYERGLAALDSIAAEAVLSEHYLLHAARADFLRRLGRTFEATIAYRRALTTVPTLPERAFLEQRLGELRRAELG
jgi:RNA polymerase sigma-70 factor, ECF subfamily